MKSLLWLPLFFCAFIPSASADNWPAWRGPAGLGLTAETDLPIHWSATENVKWKIALPERGNSTPVIWEDKIFLTQPVLNEKTRALFCFDRKNGKILWQKNAPYEESEKSHQQNPYCSSSPVTDGKRVFVWFGSAGVFCYNVDGKQVWHRDLGKQEHTWGYGSSPVLYKDLCILHFGPGKRSFLIALDKDNGKTVWEKEIPEVQPAERTDGFAGQRNGEIGSWSTPIIINANGRDELVVSLPEWLIALDPKKGHELWRCAGLNPLVYSSPIYGDGVVVAMGGFHGTSIACKPNGTGDVTATHRLWQVPRNPNRLGSGVIHDGHVYVINTPGIAECIDLQTGKTIYEERLPSKGAKSEVWSSMVLSGDKIYVLNQSGDCIVLRAAPKFEVIAVNSIGNELTNGSLAVSDGELFIRTHQHLWCIGKPKDSAAVETAKPLKILFLTGGGYHDYEKLAPHLTNSLGQKVNASFEVRFDMSILKNERFADPYDAVVYDLCFDAADSVLLENAMKATRAGKPTVMIHCAVHAFRQSAIIGDWESCCGMKSKFHDPYQSFTTEKLDKAHPVTRDFPDSWRTPGDELYQTIQFFDTSKPLLKAKSPTDGREHIVCWTHNFGKGRVFATTLGHDMKTAESPDYIRLLANGLLWACGKL